MGSPFLPVGCAPWGGSRTDSDRFAGPAQARLSDLKHIEFGFDFPVSSEVSALTKSLILAIFI
jgi:hypothetical protein